VSRLERVLELVQISSVSRDEATLASHVESVLSSNPRLSVDRIGDNVVARTNDGRDTRLLVAGHLDTVPGDAGAALIDGTTLRGLGACDMKASLAVMLELALQEVERPVDVTWVFYAREEIARSESGLLEIAQARPDLLEADAAVLGEPTNFAVEAGCQGNLRVLVRLRGVRAHSARPFTGRNAIHRLAPFLTKVAAYEPREVVLDSVAFTEQLQAVLVHGGIAGNVVPDEVDITLNHRFAPDRSSAEAEAWLRSYVEEFLEVDDDFEVLDAAPSGQPSLSNPHLERLVSLTATAPVGKVGWTDVATFQQLGIAATNFGAGDPLLAHRSDESVTEAAVDHFAEVLQQWLS